MVQKIIYAICDAGICINKCQSVIYYFNGQENYKKSVAFASKRKKTLTYTLYINLMYAFQKQIKYYLTNKKN